MAQRLDRIERIDETVPVGGARHKLRDARCTFGAHGAGIETTFLPDHTGKKLDGKAILRRRLLQCAANVIDCRRSCRQSLLSAWRGRLIALFMLRSLRDCARLRMGRDISPSDRADKQ